MLDIKVVGSGCANCKNLENLCVEVTTEQDIKANIDKITDINKFTEFGVFKTPGLIVNGEVVSQGKIPTKFTLEHWLKEKEK